MYFCKENVRLFSALYFLSFLRKFPTIFQTEIWSVTGWCLVLYYDLSTVFVTSEQNALKADNINQSKKGGTYEHALKVYYHQKLDLEIRFFEWLVLPSWASCAVYLFSVHRQEHSFARLLKVRMLSLLNS